MAGENSSVASISRRERAFWLVLFLAGAALYSFRLIAHFGGYDWETAQNGNLARGLIEGLAGPWWSYQYHPASRGTVIFGILLTPLFYFGGSAILWTRVLTGLMVVAGLVFWTIAVRRSWGRRAAALFALLCIFPPPRFDLLLHASYANHIESVFFTGLLLLLFARKPNPLARWGALLAAGFIGGFATLFSLENILFVAALFLALLVDCGFGQLRRLLLWTAPTFAMGFSPHFLSPDSVARQITEATPSSSLATWLTERYYTLYRILFDVAGGYQRLWLTRGFFVVAAVGYCLLLRRTYGLWKSRSGETDTLGAAILFYAVVFLAAYAVSKSHMGPNADFTAYFALHYLAVILPFLLAYFCYIARGLPLLAGFCCATPFLVAGMWSIAAELPDDAGALRHRWTVLTYFTGDEKDYFVDQCLPRTWTGSAERTIASIQSLTPGWRCAGFVAFGRTLSFARINDLLASRTIRDQELVGCLVRGFGVSEGAGISADPNDAAEAGYRLTKRIGYFAATAPILAERFVEGFGFGALPSWRNFDKTPGQFFG